MGFKKLKVKIETSKPDLRSPGVAKGFQKSSKVLVADFPSRWRDESAFCHEQAIKCFPINIAQNISRSAGNRGALESPAQFSLYSTINYTFGSF